VRERYRPYSFDTRFFERASGRIKRCPGCFNVVDEDRKFMSCVCMRRKCVFYICASRRIVEWRLWVRRPRTEKEGFKRNPEDRAEVASDQFRLVESAFALPARVERNGDENRARRYRDTKAQKVISENLRHHGRKRADAFVFKRVDDRIRGFRLIGKRRKKV